ncbi:creatininase family protein [Pelagicoccus albus]|nr:creatininase family protein [Pelagicoccus albus]
MGSGLSLENTSRELADSQSETAILVFGGAEQCGPCLPCCIDSLLADFLADRYAESLHAFRTPVFPYNTSQEHGNLAGTLSLPASLMQTITEHLVCQLSQQGYRRFILLSPHGGSHWESSAIKEINAANPNITLISAKDGAADSIPEARLAAGLTEGEGLHGGLLPLCSTAFFHPDLVKAGSFGSLHPEQNEAAFNYGLLRAFSEDGCWGDPIEVKAEQISEYAEKGKLLWTTFAEAQANRLDTILNRVDSLRQQLASKA